MRTDESKKRLWLALIIYVFLSLLYFGTIGDYNRMYLGYGGDPLVYIWCLNWWPWAIAHGLNPFISFYVWFPHGFNMTWANSVASAALLMSPVTWWTNSVVSYNILSLLAPAMSAWVAFILARYLTQDMFASFIGGYLFGFSSYELGQMLGHLSLNLTFLVPLFVLLVVKRIRGDITRSRFVVLLSISLLIQVGLATEILATACFFGAIAWGIFLVFGGVQERRRLWTVAYEIVLAAVLMVVLAAPFLYYVVKGIADKSASVNTIDPEAYSSDLLNYLIPTEVTRLGGSFFGNLSHRFAGNSSEQGAYLGLPLILLLMLQFRDLRRRSYLRPLLFSLLLVLILSLGPSLHVAGVATKIWLPWWLGLHLPLIHQALPIRFSMYVALATALIVALWLSAARSWSNRVGRFSLAALACICLVPTPTFVPWTRLAFEAFFEPQNVVATLGKNANVVMLPYGHTGPSMIWQWQSGMRFTQSGGYVSLPPQWETVWPVVDSFYTGVTGPDFESDISAFCTTHHISAILIGPGTPNSLVAAVHALRWQETTYHGVKVVRVPDPQFLHFHYILGDYWLEDGWMGKQVNIVTRGQPMQLRISGQYRPPALGPAEILFVNGLESSKYSIAQESTQILNLPADSSVTLTAPTTFVPDQVICNGDRRALSVRIILQPNVGTAGAR
jgi:hypothetical protein